MHVFSIQVVRSIYRAWIRSEWNEMKIELMVLIELSFALRPPLQHFLVLRSNKHWLFLHFARFSLRIEIIIEGRFVLIWYWVVREDWNSEENSTFFKSFDFEKSHGFTFRYCDDCETHYLKLFISSTFITTYVAVKWIRFRIKRKNSNLNRINDKNICMYIHINIFIRLICIIWVKVLI